jgi:hypothetical protein
MKCECNKIKIYWEIEFKFYLIDLKLLNILKHLMEFKFDILNSIRFKLN